MTSAIKNSFAFKKWEDDFFLTLEIPDDNTVSVETRKKEDRSHPTVDMHFQDFVEIYNETEQYMVNPVPDFLGNHILLPGPLHCPQVFQNLLVENIMWFSSGGTKSVVHTDSVENIICLIRGDKQFVMVDPKQYPNQVYFDHPEGAYSSLDVDNVDYSLHPELEEILYYHVNLTAGDCLYIPFKWIHQVRSFERNIAVNVWWDHYGSLKLDYSACPDSFDDSLTFDNLEFGSFAQYMNQPDALRDTFYEFSLNQDLDIEKFVKYMIGQNPPELPGLGIGYQLPLRNIFRLADVDRDGLLHPNEVLAIEDNDWPTIERYMKQFEAIMARIDAHLEEMDDEEEDEDDTDDEWDGETDELELEEMDEWHDEL